MTQHRVLVVDDSPQNRLVATGHLESAGFAVSSAASGEDALEVLAKERIDLVVLDVLMPGLGGFETCRRIRQTPAIAETPVLFLTAMGDREATQPALDAGGDDLLPKPFLRAELLLRVNALIRQRQTTSELRQAMRALAEQNEQLRRANYDRRRMSNMIVHDLKNPIVGVLANAEMLLEAPLNGDYREALHDVLVAARHIDRTAHTLLELAKAEDGTIAPQLEAFDMKQLAKEVIASLRGFARWTSVRLDIDVRIDRVIADRELTRRILQNLVHNAVKHAPEGSVVVVDARVDGDDLLLSVVDDGPGIPPDQTEHIFETGVTLGGTGAGLGLAFCRLAAEAHGGKIWVEAKQPKGASFVVRIPQPQS